MRGRFRTPAGEIWIRGGLINRSEEKEMNEQLLSPASGKIIRIGEEKERTISIFMHLHNVHVTTAPLDGVVKKITAEKGSFKPAFLRSADFNTRRTPLN